LRFEAQTLYSQADIGPARGNRNMKKSNFKRVLQAALLSVLIIAVSAATVTATENLTVHFIDPTFRSKIPDFANFPNCDLAELKNFLKLLL
jgi:hypothetical protein